MRIRELRRDANMSQKMLAEKIGVSAQVLCNYEKGRRMIPVSLLPPIKEALGCTWDELFEEEGTK